MVAHGAVDDEMRAGRMNSARSRASSGIAQRRSNTAVIPSMYRSACSSDHSATPYSQMSSMSALARGASLNVYLKSFPMLAAHPSLECCRIKGTWLTALEAFRDDRLELL